MTLDFTVWRQNVVAATQTVADESFQRRVWFGGGPEVSDPNEAVCQLMDSAGLEDFLAETQNGLSADEQAAGDELLQRMKAFSAATPVTLHGAEVIDHPLWQEARVAAQRFLALLEMKASGGA